MKVPSKPYPPFKPKPPDKEIKDVKTLKVLTYQEDGEFSVQWFQDYIIENFPNEDSSKVKFSMEIDKDYGYYDDVSTSLNITFYITNIVPNPKYNKMYSKYEKELAKYKKDYVEYKSNLKQYEIDQKKYQEELEIQELKRAQSIIAKFEKKQKAN